MRVSKTLVILFVVLTTCCCVTEKAQKMQNNTQATPANLQTVKSDEQAIRPEAQNNEWLTYEPTVVELKGRLVVKTYFGPPNYGENPKTDSKEELPVLALSKPVNVRGNPDPDAGYERISVEHIREMELVLAIPHERLIGKEVLVKGTLFHAFTGHHHTDVLMDVQSISLAVPD